MLIPVRAVPLPPLQKNRTAILRADNLQWFLRINVHIVLIKRGEFPLAMDVSQSYKANGKTINSCSYITGIYLT